MTTMGLVYVAVKLAGACGLGVGATALMQGFHKYEFKFKKKGEGNDSAIHSQSLRERAKSIR
jgi:hypothetical protein